jgi:type II secretory pathway pseudopilin PulG
MIPLVVKWSLWSLAHQTELALVVGALLAVLYASLVYRLRGGYESTWEDERGHSLIDLVVAFAVFSIFALTIDAVSIVMYRSTTKASISIETQQNARMALERLTKEVRQADSTKVTVVPNSVSFDGPVTGSLTYSLNGTTLYRNGVPIARNVQNFAVSYSKPILTLGIDVQVTKQVEGAIVTQETTLNSLVLVRN